MQALARAGVVAPDTSAGAEAAVATDTPPGSLSGATSRLSLSSPAPTDKLLANGKVSEESPLRTLQRSCEASHVLRPSELHEAAPRLSGAHPATLLLVNRSMNSATLTCATRKRCCAICGGGTRQSSFAT
jgi:hypothetical protein